MVAKVPAGVETPVAPTPLPISAEIGSHSSILHAESPGLRDVEPPPQLTYQWPHSRPLGTFTVSEQAVARRDTSYSENGKVEIVS